MSQNGTYGNWENFDQTDLFNKLDIAFTIILGIAGILTFPPACCVYFRILTLKGFENQYLMKLFVLNGMSNLLIYLVNLISVQFSNWPSANAFYTWLRTNILSLILRFLQEYAMWLMWLTTFFISLNRLLSLKNQYVLSKYDRRYFIIASLTSTIVSAIISIPIFFSHHTYNFPRKCTFGYIPYIPDDYIWTFIPSQIIQLVLVAATLIINFITCIIIVRIRKVYSVNMESRPEQGLLLSSFLSVLMHVLHVVFLLLAKFLNDVRLAYFITLTVAVSTTLPFWTLMICATNMRRAILSGTGFGAPEVTTVRVRKISSAHF